MTRRICVGQEGALVICSPGYLYILRGAKRSHRRKGAVSEGGWNFNLESVYGVLYFSKIQKDNVCLRYGVEVKANVTDECI